MSYLFFAVLATVSSIFGGMLPLYTKINNIKTQYLIGFASGILISTAIFEILPEAVINIGKSNFAIPVSLGFFSLYVLEKWAMIHACRETGCDVHDTGWVGMIGLSLESLLDGIAIAIGYLTNPFLGILIAIAVVVHELPVGFCTSIIMRASGYSVKKSMTVLVMTSSLTIVGALISTFFPINLFGYILAFTAGTFLYIGAGDLLPEAHKSVDWWVVLTVVLGAVTIPFIARILAF